MLVRALVGRRRELEVLDEAFDGVLKGQRGVVMITGEPGIGKTRLLEELATKVTALGGVVAWGRMLEVGLTPAFWPWEQVLGELAFDGLRAPDLVNLAPSVGASARLTRFAEVTAFLARRAEQSPLVVLLDDLHTADPSSLQLLEYVLPHMLGRRVMFALSARDTGAQPDIAPLLGKIQRSAIRLPLLRLQAEDVATLVAGRADVQQVIEWSDGNPLFVEEVVASKGNSGSLGLPKLSSARSVIHERLSPLPEGTRTALAAGALLGREFRGSLVANMLELEELAPVLQPALDLGILESRGADGFRFSHALLAEALTDSMGAAERARIHLAAARALERLDSTNIMALAHQLLSAGHLASYAAVTAAERAAEACMGQFAFEDAAGLLERALQILAAVAPADHRKRAELLCQRAQALQLLLQHTAAAALCDEAAGLTRALADTDASEGDDTQQTNAELFAHIALARGLEFRFGHPIPTLIALLREALERLGEQSPALRAKLLARLAAAEQPAQNPNGPVARAFEAIELARQLGPSDRLYVMYVATSALVEYVDAERLESIHNEVLHLSLGVDRAISVHTRLRLCFTALERIDRQAFDAAVQAFTQEAQALGLPQWRRHGLMLAAMKALLEGRFADAEAEAQKAEGISQTLGDTGNDWLIAVHRAMVAWVRTAPVDPAIKARIGEYVPARAAIAAWFAAQEGSRERAREALGELEDRIPFDPDLSCMVATAIAVVGDAQLARHAYEALTPRSGRIIVAAVVGSAVMDLFDRLLLVLASTAGMDAITFHAERALSIASRLGSPPWAARVQIDWAEALARRAGAGDAAQALSLVERALPEAERLEMPGLVARCHALEAQLTGGLPSSTDPSLPIAPVAVPSTAANRVEFNRQGSLWSVRSFGELIFIKDSRGLRMIHQLVQNQGTPIHVLDLTGREGLADGGDAGPALDERARTAYRRRVAELTDELREAESLCDLGRSERAREEMQALTAELERAFGLGGRERRVGAASERARSNVQRRIAHALSQIRTASPRLAEHLSAAIRTGTFCSYEPFS